MDGEPGNQAQKVTEQVVQDPQAAQNMIDAPKSLIVLMWRAWAQSSEVPGWSHRPPVRTRDLRYAVGSVNE